jgi:hypothetical protein
MDLVAYQQQLYFVADNTLSTTTKVIANKHGVVAPPFRTQIDCR